MYKILTPVQSFPHFTYAVGKYTLCETTIDLKGVFLEKHENMLAWLVCVRWIIFVYNHWGKDRYATEDNSFITRRLVRIEPLQIY